MIGLHFPYLELTIFLPAFCCALVILARDTQVARVRCLWVSGATLVAATVSWLDFATLHVFEAHDDWSMVELLTGRELIVVDEFSAPLLPLTALGFFLTLLATVGLKTKNFSYSWALIAESLTLCTLSAKEPWWLVLMLTATCIPMLAELKSRKQSIRPFLIYQLLFVVCAVAGVWLATKSETPSVTLSSVLLAIAVLIRSGTVPAHFWLTDMMDRASFGSAMLFVTPMLGAYACMRLVLPMSPDWALRMIGLLSLATAVYASCMALVQTDARRFFSFLFLSHSSLVLVGLELVTPIGLTGALCLWMSVGIALTGFGITLRCIEARVGRVSLDQYYGLYSHMPTMAAFFLMTGLASVGFPCTIGFIATELLIDGAITLSPVVGCFVVFSTMLNSIAVVHAYFRIFTGTKRTGTIPLVSQTEERVAVIVLSGLILGGGLFPQAGVESRYRAAIDLMENLHMKLPDRGHVHPPATE